MGARQERDARSAPFRPMAVYPRRAAHVKARTVVMGRRTAGTRDGRVSHSCHCPEVASSIGEVMMSPSHALMALATSIVG